MAENGIIVKKLASIEDLGNMNVLCIDKTGTMTQNKIVLSDYVNLDKKRDEEIIELALTNDM